MKEKKEKQKRGKISYRGKNIIVMIAVLLGIVALVGHFAGNTSRKMSENQILNIEDRLSLVTNVIENYISNNCSSLEKISRDYARDGVLMSGDYIPGIKAIALVKFSEPLEAADKLSDIPIAELDFSKGEKLCGLPVSKNYIGSDGTWCYTVKVPVTIDGRHTGDIYGECSWDDIRRNLPASLYGGEATIYVLDTISDQTVVDSKLPGLNQQNPKNTGDFMEMLNFSAEEKNKEADIEHAVVSGEKLLFYRNISGRQHLVYIYPLNDGVFYVLGSAPSEAIQKEAATVRHTIILVAVLITGVVLMAITIVTVVYRKRVREREEYNRTLQEALDIATDANAAKTTFLSNMSHDIRTPLNSVIGFSELLQRDAGDEEKVREYTKKITAAGNHLLGLISDILDISKIESGKLTLKKELFSMNSLAEQVEAVVSSMAAAKEQSFTMEVGELEHTLFVGDSTRLKQILIDLLSNAVKYTGRHGRVKLIISQLEHRSGVFDNIRFVVDDNGCGMSREFQRVMFDPFTRAENVTARRESGSGLGLAITRNIVELMGGTISVISEEGRGTRITVDLAFRIPDEEAGAHFWQEHNIKKILISDSASDGFDELRRDLSDTGITVDTAYGPEEAQKKMSVQRYDAVFSNSASLSGTTPDTLVFLPESSADENADGAVAFPLTGTRVREMMIEAVTARRERCPEYAEISLKGARFLAAEDNAMNAQLLSAILRKEGASCDIMENGKLVVDKFVNSAPGTYDEILMDVMMPEMNGYEATRAIRSSNHPQAQTIPIIAMTANVFVDDVQKALNAGMNSHIVKPLEIEDMKKTLSAFIKSGRSR